MRNAFISLAFVAALLAPVASAHAQDAQVSSYEIPASLATVKGAPAVSYSAPEALGRPGTIYLLQEDGAELGQVQILKDGTTQLTGEAAAEVQASLSTAGRTKSAGIIVTIPLGSYDTSDDCTVTLYADVDLFFGSVSIYGEEVCVDVSFE